MVYIEGIYCVQVEICYLYSVIAIMLEVAFVVDSLGTVHLKEVRF